ncbi:CocE/NonD family hydrolase [Parvibaculaceae bacterium PLY_AMNH_Bact1]|nr:CocE/NonD family hydrolase [Parvibaculaceae bacterium PLY_AMNH_Bact1]
MLDTIDTLRAVWPMLSRAVLRGQLFSPQCTLVDPDPDIRCDYDVAVPIGDDVVLTANVFRSHKRSEAGEIDPVVMCAHPYDNHLSPALGKTPFGGPPHQYRVVPQAGGRPEFSTLTSWEAPDPNFWVPAGYTLVNLNLAGFANSGGTATLLSRQQGEEFYAAIKWIAEQSWCDGNIGLTGVSYLAISQYFAAMAAEPDGENSPLKCISPWEGISDIYRDIACRGGVADGGFFDGWWNTEIKTTLNNPRHEFIAREGALPKDLVSVHPLYDDYWAGKTADFSKVRTPMLVCASFSDHELHTPGSCRAYQEAASPRKWIYTHREGKWVSYYSDEVKALLLDFMDHHLKGKSNRFDDLKPLRLEVRSDRETIKDVRWESEWPLPHTEYRPLFLTKKRLASEPQKKTGELSYHADGGSASFDMTFDQNTELSGFMKLRLWVEVRPEKQGGICPDDIILCVYVDKRDRNGRAVRFNGSVGITNDTVTRGIIRASRRELDAEKSTEWLPVFKGDSVQKLAQGDIVPVEIPLCASSTFFAAGEGLRLIVSSKEEVVSPVFHKVINDNVGRHVVHIGGDYDSHLLVPVIS